MPTVRTKLARHRHRRINAEAVAAFRTAERTQGRYLACLRGEGCASLNGRRCGTCRTHIESLRDLRMALSLPPWHVSPADPGLDGPMPAYMRNLAAGGTWQTAVELRRQLEAAKAL